MSDDKQENQEKLNQYTDDIYGFKREEFDSWIEKLNAYRKEEFLEDDLIDKDLAWEIRGCLGSNFYEVFRKTLRVYDGRGTKIIVILGCLTAIFFAIKGLGFSLNANSYLTVIALMFFIRHMCRLCGYYQYVINPKKFNKNGLWSPHYWDDSYMCGFFKSAIHFEGNGFITVFILLRITISPPELPLYSERDFFLIQSFLVLYNLLLYIPIVKSLKYELSNYKAQELLPYLLDFAELNIAVPFWTCFIVLLAVASYSTCPWIIFPLLPIVLYFKKKLDFQFLLKNVLLNYQKCVKG